MKNQFRLWALPARDVVELGRLWIDLALTDLRLKVLPHAANRALLFPAEEESSTPSGWQEPRIFRLARLVAMAARFPMLFDMSCLRRSLVLRSRLGTLGVSARLVYGVARGGGTGLCAHVWLESGEVRIGDHPDAFFSRFGNPGHPVRSGNGSVR